MQFNFQIHKYKNGHQLVASTLELSRADQDTVDRLSDISGQLRPGELFDPYFTCYAVPSEKYFIVARTWQDLEAPRAGCVLTKSIIIQMHDWEIHNKVQCFFTALVYSEFDLTYPIITTENKFDNSFKGIDAPVEELVEALFLEQRKPILIFDCKDEAQIVVRLYSVFWPNLRRKFATCTYSLAPRSVNNRPFDLLFSNNIMRTRFSDWAGRRIEGAINNRKMARHRWTHELTKRIFKSSEPSLYDKSITSLFDFSQNSNENTLRLSLLWDELVVKAKSESSPIAILGLLDIINSQPVFVAALYQSLEPYINRAVNDALNILPPNEAWKFYAGLLVKHKRKLMGRDMLFGVKEACTELTRIYPDIAIDFISSFNPISENIPSMLYASIGNGLSELSSENTFNNSQKISSLVNLHFLATSLTYAKMLMDRIQNGEKQLNKTIESSLFHPDIKAVQRAKLNLMQFIRSPSHSQVLQMLLSDIAHDAFSRLLKNIAENTKFLYHEFDDLLIKSAGKNNSYDRLLEMVVKYADKHRGEEFLIELFVSNPQLIESYLALLTFTEVDSRAVICETINILSEDKLIELAGHRSVIKQIIPLLLESEKFKPVKVAELILISDLPIGESLSAFNKLPTNVINSVDPEKLFKLILKAFGKPKPNSFAPLLKKLDQAQTVELVRRFFNPNNAYGNILLVFQTFLKSTSLFKKSMAKMVDVVSETLANQLSDDIDIESVENWIELLRLSNDSDKRRRAAFEMLGYAFKGGIADPTKLISISFPIVYDTFLHGKSLVQSIAYWVFSDWDKCKTLRYDLVERYLASNWPMMGLFDVAKKSGILKDVIYILSNSKQGKKFMEHAYFEILNGPFQVDKAIVKQLKKHIKEK